MFGGLHSGLLDVFGSRLNYMVIEKVFVLMVLYYFLPRLFSRQNFPTL